MIAIWRPFLAVPLIALIDGLIMGLGDSIYVHVMDDSTALEWPFSFWTLFPITAFFALIMGMTLGPIFYFLGKHIPEPKLSYFIWMGVFLGPIPLLIFSGRHVELNGFVTFIALGALSGYLWWFLVEKHRVEVES